MSLLKANSVQIGQSSTATNNFTLSVPASPDGTIKLARGNSGATTADVLSVASNGRLSFNLPPIGSVLQVVTSQYTSSVSTTSTSFVDVGVSATITPSASSNRVAVLFQGQMNLTTANTILVNVLRGSTLIAQPSSGVNPSSFNIFANSTNYSWPTSFFWVDSPSTTSATTYKLQWRTDGAGTAYLGRHNSNTDYNTPYSITLIEIAG